MQRTNSRIGKTGVTVALLLVILLGGVAVNSLGAAAGGSQVADPNFVGTWRVDIQGESAVEGEFVNSSFTTFMADGTMLTSGRTVLPAPPDAPVPVFYLSTGHGVWESTGKLTMAGIFVNQRSDSDGNFLGTTTVNLTAEMSEDGMTYAGTSDVVIANPAGETVATRSDVVTAERVVVEQSEDGTPEAVRSGAVEP